MEEYINNFFKELEEKSVKVDSGLFKLLQERVINKISTKDGKIEFSQDNIQNILEAQKLIELYASQQGAFWRYYADGIIKLSNLVQSNFAVIGSPELMLRAEFSVKNNLAKIGIEPNGNIIKGGFISEASKMKSIQQGIGEWMLKNITTGRDFSNLLNEFQRYVQGQELSGQFEKYVKMQLHDTSFRFIRVQNNLYADTIGLNYFLYQGTIIDTTREFCKKRAGKVFHRSDVSSWKVEEYMPTPYNFFEDMGGYNCRHTIRWLSNEIGTKLYKGNIND